MNVNNLLNFLELHFPSRFAMKDDKFGLEVQTGTLELNNLLVCYEINEQVIEEAVGMNCQLILTYHPFIYFPISRLYSTERMGKLLTLIIRNGISVVSLHTRFDTYKYGSNYILAKALGLEIDSFLEENNEDAEFGMGIIGHFSNKILTKTFLEKVYGVTKSVLKYTEGNSKYISKVGIVAGSGKEFINQAIAKELDAFISADISYHYFHSANDRLWLVDAGHWETEQFIAAAITEFLKRNLDINSINIIQSQINTNPIKYFGILNIEN
ncbi:MAG TPA: Nif3-like dinuclear metal center hexameric protein [Bacteroidetes bacterium]|nr:Nif3-like dinuclear metal center hexameric protein [Bacteroidota bacterium]